MALVHYTARVQDERLLELPEEARQLHLAPGQEVEIQLDPVPADQPAPAQDPALALFAQWEREDAARSPEQAASDERLWEQFERGIAADRQAQGMRPLLVSRVIVLDTFPLSSTAEAGAAPGQSPGLSDQCRDWVGDCLRAGHRVVAPAVCYYEALRELERLKAPGQIERLRQFCFSVPDRYLSLTDAHLELAARLWAQARNAGTPTAGSESLDVDVLLAAQALLLGVPPGDLVIATTNVGHLSQFVPAAPWADIAP